MEIQQLKKYFDQMPLAFTIIEIILDEKGTPVDFVFRYANQALADLEEVALDSLIGSYFFAEVFRENHDRKWLRYYYSSAFLQQTREFREFSPELDKYLKVISYPWPEPGHCACIVFDETELVIAEKQLEHLARYDKTTQFNNRNAYIEFRDRFQPESSVGVVFVDINELKETNDRYGHDSGDFLFRMVRDGINNVFEGTFCQIFRIGGDEFIIILPGASQEQCQKQALALQKNMENQRVPHMPPVLASVGWSWGEKDVILENLVKQADSSMYEQKRRYYQSHSGS